MVLAGLKTDVMIFCGGSILNSGNKNVKNIYIKSLSFQKEVWGMGVSIGPFATINDERIIKEVLKRFTYLAVRDRKSYELAQSLDLDAKIILSGDIASLINYKSSFSKRDNKFRVGFSPSSMSLELGNSKSICDRFYTSIKNLNVQIESEVILINLNYNDLCGDKYYIDYLYNKLRCNGIDAKILNYDGSNLNYILNSIENLSCYVTARLHGAVMAYILQTPFLLLEHHEKCQSFLDDILYPSNLRDQSCTNEFIIDDFFKKIIDNNFYKFDVEAYKSLAKKSFIEAPILKK
jgi:polysaccharide pyruvyl transferase WcaK-like protein